MRCRVGLPAAVLACAWAAAGSRADAAAADAYPSRPVRFIVPFAPGALNDVLARTISGRLTDLWGQQVVVDNRGGGATIIGTELAARAPADGYTLLLASLAHAINPSLYRKLPYDLLRDFAPVTLIGSTPFLLVVHPSIPARTVPEFVVHAKGRAGALSYGSTGAGGTGHLMGEMLKTLAGIDMIHVPYKGLAPALNDLIAGQIQVSFGSYSTVGGHWKSGRIRAIAVTSLRRSPTLPDLPAISETYPGYEATPWWGVLLPSGTPREIVTRVHADIVRVVRMPDVRERLVVQGLDVAATTPAEFTAFLKTEIARWGPLVKASGARAD